MIRFLTIWMSLCLFAYTTPAQNQATIPALRRQLNKARHDTTRLHIYTSLAEQYSNNETKRLDSALFFGWKGIELARKYRLHMDESRLYLHLGYYYKRIKHFSKARQTFIKGLKRIQGAGITPLRCRLTYRLACIYRDEGMFHKAINYASASGAMAAQLRDSIQQLRALGFLAITYQDVGAVNTSLAYAEKTNQLTRKMIHRYPEYAGTFTSTKTMIAELYEANGYFGKAYPYWKDAYEEFSAQKNMSQLSEVVARLGYNYLSQRRPADAIRHIDEVRQRKEIDPNSAEIFEIYALAYQQLGDIGKALANMQKAYALALKFSPLKGRQAILKTLISLEEQKKQYPLALAHMHELATLNDSLFTIRKTEAIAKAEALYKLADKEQTISLLRKNAEIRRITAERNRQELAFQQQRQQLLWFAVVTLITGLIALFLFFRRASKTSRALSAQKREIEEKAARLNELNTLKDKLFAIISHDLRSPVATLKVFLQSLQLKPERKYFPQYDLLKDNVDNMYITIDNLLHWSRLQQGALTAHLQPQDAGSITNMALNLYQSQATLKQQTITTRIETTTIVADEQHLLIIVRNLLQNAIKFSPIGGHIGITVQDKDGHAVIRIQDSGTGIPADVLSVVTNRPATSRRGTANEKGTGLGLDICYELLRLNQGTIAFDSSAAGTTVTVMFTNQTTDA